MDDKEIVQLYWDREHRAITETASKYGGYCNAIAKNILGNQEDTEECVNDTYLNAWNSLPPHRPAILSTYLGKITRNLAFDRFRSNHAEKRGKGEINLVLDELAECVSGTDCVEDAVNQHELMKTINAFLATLPKEKCDIFLLRYWYVCPVSEIAEKCGMTTGSVSAALSRMRRKLKAYLIERGYDL